MNENDQNPGIARVVRSILKLLFLLSAVNFFTAPGCSKGGDSSPGKRGTDWGNVQDFPSRGAISDSPGPGMNFQGDVYYYSLSADQILEEADLTSRWQGGGPTWEAIILAGLEILNVDVKDQIFPNSEGDAVFIESPNRESLETISKVAGKALTDEEFRDEAIKQAIRMKIME